MRSHKKDKQGSPVAPRIALFGNFGVGNLGNNTTLEATLFHLRSLAPDAEIMCICTGTAAVASKYGIRTVPINKVVVGPWTTRNPIARLARKLLVGVPSEIYRWFCSFRTLHGVRVLIVPGTGLLNDAFGMMRDDGPYSVFRWSLAARLSGCKLLFLSVGAGPLYSRVGRFFVKSALVMADYRSYRDVSTQQYLQSIGFVKAGDRVYPDLVFSLSDRAREDPSLRPVGRLVVGIGLMGYAGRYSIEKPDAAAYARYLEALAGFVEWILERGYDVRLLLGDSIDAKTATEFKQLLKARLTEYDDRRIIDEPVESIEALLSQIAATDLVVATRFHNVLMSMVLDKPVLAISFHHKCSALMEAMGMPHYCVDIHSLTPQLLIERFYDLEKHDGAIRASISSKAAQYRAALDEQYRLAVACANHH
ncbi:MAG: polysaccharide pyruvyl transferase family protein [Acidobacteriaceae bacterium]